MTETEMQKLQELRKNKDWQANSYHAALYYCANVSLTANVDNFSHEEARRQYAFMLEHFINGLGPGKCVSSMLTLLIGFVSFEEVLKFISEYESSNMET